MKKICGMKGCSQKNIGHLYELEIENRSQESSLLPEVPKKVLSCRACLVKRGFFCSKHQCVMHAVYRPECQISDGRGYPIRVQTTCLACAAEKLDALDPAEESDILKLLDEFESAVPEHLLDTSRLATPAPVYYERIVAYNLIVEASLEGKEFDRYARELILSAQAEQLFEVWVN